MGISILIVDDDKLLVEKLEETVNWSGIGIDMVFTANNIRQAQKLLEEYPIEMLLCDIDMPQGNWQDCGPVWRARFRQDSACTWENRRYWMRFQRAAISSKRWKSM